MSKTASTDGKTQSDWKAKENNQSEPSLFLMNQKQAESKELPIGWVINPQNGEKIDLTAFFYKMDLFFNNNFSDLSKDFLEMSNILMSYLSHENCAAEDIQQSSLTLVRLAQLFNELQNTPKNEA